MPRKFTPREEEQIREALLKAGRTIMGARGCRKTSIDELAHAAGISKGSFYRFFRSKESLALELLAAWERDFHRVIEDRFRESRPRGVGEAAALLVAVILEDFPRRMGESGLQALFTSEEVAHLKRAAGSEEVRGMDEQDIRLITRLKPLLLGAGLAPTEADEVVIAGLRMAFGAAMEISARQEGAGREEPLQPHHYRRAFGLLMEGFLSCTFRNQ